MFAINPILYFIITLTLGYPITRNLLSLIMYIITIILV